MKDLKYLLENTSLIPIFYEQIVKFIDNSDFRSATANLKCIYHSLYHLLSSGFISHSEYLSIDSELFDKFDILYSDKEKQ